jgi:hypothetical protein
MTSFFFLGYIINVSSYNENAKRINTETFFGSVE